MNNKGYLFIFTLLIVVSVFFLAAFTLNFTYTILITISLLVILFITKFIWWPKDHGKNKIRKLSLLLASSIVFVPIWEIEVVKLLFYNNIIKPIFGEIPIDSLEVNAIPTSILIFLFAVIFVVNYFMRDKTAMGIHPDDISKDIKERDFDDRLVSVCDSLHDDLRSIDIKTNWSSKRFVALEAEVEVRTKNGSTKKVSDLLKSIRKSKDRLFLVLGDPGSGKSVALRKLAMDLCDEASKTGKIPVYINLKEWKPNRTWSIEKPPTLEEFFIFIKSNLNNKDIVTKEFFNKYFDRLYETGRLYFILDSFDEIPHVLDQSDNSEIIKQLSYLFFKFLKGARSDSSQGILASRIFRKPTIEFQANTTLEIRPLDEKRIINILQKNNYIDQDIINTVFKERLDLIPVARNPFTLALIGDYINKNTNELPPNQSSLYESFITKTLIECQELIEEKQLSIKEVLDFSKIIANELFKTNSLEIPLVELKSKFPNVAIEEIIYILTFCRIGKLGSNNSRQFSYVHRRFCEYFAIQYVIDKNEKVDFEAIPNDSKWRDALVLYCEVVSFEEAKEIANYCWKQISEAESLKDKKALHCLRFLNDAFKGRKECLVDFQDQIPKLINKEIDKKENLLLMKFTLESVGLIFEKNIDNIIVKAFEINNTWLNEICLKSCRHLSKISNNLESKIIHFLQKLNILEILKNKNEIKFSLQLSNSFKKSHFIFKMKLFSSYSFIISFLILSFFYPVLSLFSILMSILMASMDNLMSSVINKGKKSFVDLFLKTLIKTFHFISLFYVFLLITFKETFLPFNIIEWNYIKDICFVLCLTIISFPFYKIFSTKKVFINILKRLVFASTAFLAPFLTFAFDYLGLFFKIVFILIASVYLLVISIRIAENIMNYFTCMNIYNKINKVKLNNREYMYNTYKSLSKSEYFRLKLMKYVQANVKSISGEWPSDDIFNLSNKKSSIILAQMEEKWLGLDR